MQIINLKRSPAWYTNKGRGCFGWTKHGHKGKLLHSCLTHCGFDDTLLDPEAPVPAVLLGAIFRRMVWYSNHRIRRLTKLFLTKLYFFCLFVFFPCLTAFSSIPCSYMSYNWLAQPTARRTDSSAFSPKSMPLASITPYRTNEIRVMTEDAHKTSKPTAIVILITRFLKQQDLHSLWPYIYSFPPPFPELPRFTSLWTSKRENVLYCTKVCDWANVNIVVQFVFHSLLNHSFFTIFCFFYCKTYASFSSEAQTHLAHTGPGSSA